MMLETGWFGYTQVYGGQHPREHRQQRRGQPTSSCRRRPRLTVGSLGDGPNGNLLSIDEA